MSRQYFTAEQGAEVTHTVATASWTDGVTLAATLDANSEYVIFWGGQFRNQSAATTDYIARVIDTTASEVFHLANQEPRATSDYFQNGGIAFITTGGAGRSVNLKVQIQGESTATISVRRARLWIIKLDPTKDFWNESLAEQGPIDGLGWQDAVTKTFTPPSGNYLFAGSCLLRNPLASTAGGYGRLSLDSGGTTPGYGAPNNDATSKVSSGYLMHATGLSGSQTIRLQYNDHGGASNAYVEYSRVLALCLDGFDNHAVSTLGTPSSDIGTTFVDAHTLTFTASAGKHLVLGNWYQGSSSTSAQHEARLYDDGDGQLSIHERTVINAGAGREIISFVPAAVDYTAGSKTLRIQRRMVSNTTATSKITEGAVIAAIQLDSAGGGGSTDNLTAASLTGAIPTLGAAALGQAHGLSASGISATPALAVAGIGQTHSLTGAGLDGGTAILGTPAAGIADTQDDLAADNLGGGVPTLGNGALGQVHGLAATGFAAGVPEIGSVALAQGQSLAAAGITAGTPEIGSAGLTEVLTYAVVSWVQLSGNVPVDTTDALEADGIETAPQIATATIGQAHALTAEGIETTPTLGTPGMSGEISLSADAIAATPTVGTASLGQAHLLAGTALGSTPSVGSAAIAQAHGLTGESISATPAVGASSVGQVHGLSASGIAATPSLGAPALGENETPVDNLTATGIETQPALGAATLAQAHALAANDNTATPTLGSATVGQTHALNAAGIETQPALGTAALEQLTGLVADGITATPDLGSAALGQVHGIGAAGISALAQLGTPSLAQVHGLAANDTDGAVPQLGSPVLFHRVAPNRPATAGRPGRTQSDRPAQTFSDRPEQMNTTRPGTATASRPRAVSRGRR